MKAVLLNSGGKDSLAVAKLLSHYELHSIHLDLGQRNAWAAQASAQRIADQFCANHEIIHVPGDWLKKESKIGGIAYQSIVFHALALLYAGARGIYIVASGLRREFQNEDFLRGLEMQLKANVKRDAPALLLPLMKLAPEEIKAIVADEPLLASTVYCNFANDSCGVCVKCKLHAEGK